MKARLARKIWHTSHPGYWYDRLVKQFILQRKNDHRLDAMKRIIDKDARHAQEKYKKAL